jgi:hypothetical protein
MTSLPPLPTPCERLSDLRLSVALREYHRLVEDPSHNLANEVLQQKEEARIAKERKEKAWQKDHAYDDLLNEDTVAMSSNQDRDEDFLDDFF